ncbi:hypothetical protein AGABI2DRAFT_193979, partial [Agaricus bisporus var. bisporus H97]|uniref:hypothetical protein n=1 Tax=Agaricus bisporus var. bisporus (strain H97 / ATCC MYA-4626 / FGSC 10389) TaxID=936046 RepID=UPI00029F659D
KSSIFNNNREPIVHNNRETCIHVSVSRFTSLTSKAQLRDYSGDPPHYLPRWESLQLGVALSSAGISSGWPIPPGYKEVEEGATA